MIKIYFSIDRFEGKTAILIGEDAKPLDVPVSMLPQGVKPGEMLLYEDGEFLKAPEKTQERRKEVADMLAKLLKSDE